MKEIPPETKVYNNYLPLVYAIITLFAVSMITISLIFLYPKHLSDIIFAGCTAALVMIGMSFALYLTTPTKIEIHSEYLKIKFFMNRKMFNKEGNKKSNTLIIYWKNIKKIHVKSRYEPSYLTLTSGDVLFLNSLPYSLRRRIYEYWKNNIKNKGVIK